MIHSRFLDLKASLLSLNFYSHKKHKSKRPHGRCTPLANGKFSIPSSLLLFVLCRVSVSRRVRPGHPKDAGRQSPGDPEEEVVGRWQVSKGGGPPSERSVNSDLPNSPFSTASVQQLTPLPPRPSTARSGHGEHRRHLRGPGVWPPGGHLHGSAGVCLDVEADPGERGERGLPNLHLLCLPLPSVAPRPPRGHQAPRFPALRRRCGLASFSPRHHQHKLKGNTSVLPHTRLPYT